MKGNHCPDFTVVRTDRYNDHSRLSSLILLQIFSQFICWSIGAYNCETPTSRMVVRMPQQVAEQITKSWRKRRLSNRSARLNTLQIHKSLVSSCRSVTGDQPPDYSFSNVITWRARVLSQRLQA